ncbi:energy transducer TonB family protein [Methylobacterium sp. Leaf85]|uniref:energy transducer TonB family protein n=1 Tax=Methylobacterium sp. Leaf85 TaxID=1736241 RepID=UPI0009EC4D1C|nr:energy transducer TonB [Methylobacterium sp. Leaf85]
MVSPVFQNISFGINRKWQRHEGLNMRRLINFIRVSVGLISFAAAQRCDAETVNEWAQATAEHIRCHLMYPPNTRFSSPLKVIVRCNVSADGSVSDINIEQSKGIIAFDQAVIAAVETADPMPNPPFVGPNGLIDAKLPLVFSPPRATLARSGLPPSTCRTYGM